LMTQRPFLLDGRIWLGRVGSHSGNHGLHFYKDFCCITTAAFQFPAGNMAVEAVACEVDRGGLDLAANRFNSY